MLINRRFLTFLIILLFGATGSIAQTDSLSLKMIGHAHIDLAYRWRWNETKDHVAYDTFKGVLNMMQKEPGLTFAQSQLALYEIVQKKYPGLFKQIKQQIVNGTWFVVGDQWCEPDESMPNGESVIRQILIGKDYAKKNLPGSLSTIIWSPDAFTGKPGSLPQIYSGCGMKYYVFMRNPPKGKRIFWWESPDGSRILAYNTPGRYNNRITHDMVDGINDWYEDTKYGEALVLYGEGDHGGGPREPDIIGINKLKEQKKFKKISFGKPDEYFEQLSRVSTEWPVWNDEIGIRKANNSTGSFTSHSQMKQANKELENELLVAERFASIGSQLQGKPFFPRLDLREAWKVLLRNQFHDILAGTCIGPVADDVMHDYSKLRVSIHNLLDFGLETIGNRIDTRGEGIPVVVYNSLSWERSDYVEANINFISKPGNFAIKDDQNKKIPFEIIDQSKDMLKIKVRFWAANIPSVGYKMFRIVNGEPDQFISDLKIIGDDMAENKYYQIRWDSEGIASLYDKISGKELLSGCGNQLLLCDELTSSSWRMKLGNQLSLQSIEKPKVIHSSALKIIVRWKDRSEESEFTREMILTAGSSRIDFRLKVDWHDKDKYLKVAFPCKINQGTAFYEQQFGAIERDQGEQEYPAQNWVDLSGPDAGIALLNPSRYGFMINDNTISMSILRSARDMNPRMDEGLNSLTYSIYPYSGDWKENGIPQKALEINQPLIVKQESKHKGETSGWTSAITLPAKYSFYGTNSDHVIISAIKVQEGNWEPQKIILRMYETVGQGDTITVKLPVKPTTVEETNHIEEPIRSQSEIKMNANSFSFYMKPHQIRTFRVSYRRGQLYE